MFRSEPALLNRQRASVERLGAFEVTLVFAEQRQVVEQGRRLETVAVERLFAKCQRSVETRNGILVFPLCAETHSLSLKRERLCDQPVLLGSSTQFHDVHFISTCFCPLLQRMHLEAI